MHDLVSVDTLKQLFERHFDGLSLNPVERKQIVSDHIKRFPDNSTYYREEILCEKDFSGIHIYAGFKVYPPLGFDPWPDDEEGQAIMDYFYKKCVENNIPIMTHCGNNEAGTETEDISKALTSPKRWKPVFERYPGLKICFAHFGLDDKTKDDQWFLLIQDYMKQYDKVKIYADMSCLGHEVSDYDKFIDLSEDDFYLDRILFGSDFPLSCFRTKDYKSYISVFDKAGDTIEKKSEINEVLRKQPL